MADEKESDRSWHGALVQLAGFDPDRPHYQGECPSTFQELLESLKSDKLEEPECVEIVVDSDRVHLSFSLLVSGVRQVYIDYEDDTDPTITRYSDTPDWVVEGWISTHEQFHLAANPVRVRCFFEDYDLHEKWPLIWVQFLDDLPFFNGPSPLAPHPNAPSSPS